MKKNLALVFGGQSSEHEVSINSARNIYLAIDKNIYDVTLLGVSKQGSWFEFSPSELETLAAISDKECTNQTSITLLRSDSKIYSYNLKTQNKKEVHCAFPIIHGTNGEDGTLQGYFKILGLPFVGCGVLSSAVGMDKEVMKIIMTSAGIPNSKFAVIHRHNPLTFADLQQQLGLPFFIKPANAGSSVGVHKIKSSEEFSIKLTDSFKYDHKILAEECIVGREIECSVMGLNHSPQAAVPGELVVKHEFYSYEAKYLDANGAEIVIPAKLNTEETEKIRALALKTYKALYCDGLTRVDFFMKANGDLIVNEINTLPGFTKISMYPMMWQAKGLAYTHLISQLIQLAFQKFEEDQQLNLDFRA